MGNVIGKVSHIQNESEKDLKYISDWNIINNLVSWLI